MQNFATSPDYFHWEDWNVNLYGYSNAHANIHAWVNGEMNTHESPGDPLFFLHHNTMSRAWAMWADCHGHDKISAADLHDHTEAYSMNPDFPSPCQDPDDPEITSYDADECWEWIIDDLSLNARNAWDISGNLGFVYAADDTFGVGGWDSECEDTWDWFVHPDNEAALVEHNSLIQIGQKVPMKESSTIVKHLAGSSETSYAIRTQLQKTYLANRESGCSNKESLEAEQISMCAMKHGLTPYASKKTVVQWGMGGICELGGCLDVCYSLLFNCTEPTPLNNYCEVPVMSFLEEDLDEEFDDAEDNAEVDDSGCDSDTLSSSS